MSFSNVFGAYQIHLYLCGNRRAYRSWFSAAHIRKGKEGV